MEGLPKDHGPASMVRVTQVDSLVQALAEGRPVSPGAVAEVKRQLLADLRSGSSIKQTDASNQISKLYRNLTSRKEQSQLVGELLVSGSAGTRLLEKELADRSPLSTFKKLAGLPLGEQLKAIAEIIAGLVGSSRPQPEPNLPSPDVDQRETAIRQKEEEKKRDLAGDGPPLTHKDLEDLIKDPAQPVSARFTAVEHLRDGAVNALIEVLLSPKADVDREFAVQALLSLSRTEAADTVQRELDILSTSGHRDVAEYLHEVIGALSHGSHPQTTPERLALISDKWLQQSVKQGDKVGMLQAGLGREAIAIPMMMAYWADLSRDWKQQSIGIE